jgi:hypothetical protein
MKPVNGYYLSSDDETRVILHTNDPIKGDFINANYITVSTYRNLVIPHFEHLCTFITGSNVITEHFIYTTAGASRLCQDRQCMCDDAVFHVW